MTEGDEGLLLQRLVTLWYNMWADYPAFQNEERPLRLEWMKQTRQRIEDLAADIYESGLPKDKKYPRPVELAALDCALFQLRQDRAGQGYEYPVIVVAGQNFLVRQRSMPRPFSLHDHQSGNLAFWLRYHRIMPTAIRGYTIHIHELKGTWPELPRESLRVFLGTFPDGCNPDWVDDHKPFHVATTVTQPMDRWTAIKAALEEAQKADAQVVLFPELTVCAEHRQKIVRWLINNPGNPFVLVVPGSFHEGGAPFLQSPFTERRNRACILNGAGDTILTQDKLVPIVVDNILKSGASQAELNRVVFEGVGSANEIHLLDTPIGLMVLTICRDLLQESSPITDLWEYVAPDWMLVPSMSVGVSGHEAAAKRLFRMYETRVLVANQCLDGKFEKTGHGFVSPLRIPVGEILPIAPHNRVANIPVPRYHGGEAWGERFLENTTQKDY